VDELGEFEPQAAASSETAATAMTEVGMGERRHCITVGSFHSRVLHKSDAL
jgi:hypothetical protein